MKRFSMAFDNPQQNRAKQNLLYAYQLQAQNNTGAVSKARGLDLASPMIGRVYKAKPGCSACGK